MDPSYNHHQNRSRCRCVVVVDRAVTCANTRRAGCGHRADGVGLEAGRSPDQDRQDDRPRRQARQPPDQDGRWPTPPPSPPTTRPSSPGSGGFGHQIRRSWAGCRQPVFIVRSAPSPCRPASRPRIAPRRRCVAARVPGGSSHRRALARCALVKKASRVRRKRHQREALGPTAARVCRPAGREPVQVRPHRIRWTRLLNGVFVIDLQPCPNCDGAEDGRCWRRRLAALAGHHARPATSRASSSAGRRHATARAATRTPPASRARGSQGRAPPRAQARGQALRAA